MTLLRLIAVGLRGAAAFRREPERSELKRLADELSALGRGEAAGAPVYPAAPSSR